MPHHKATWDKVVKQHGLNTDFSYEKLAQFDFADATFGTEYDYFSATTKLCKAGFEGQKLWSEECWVRHLNELADAKIIPAYQKDTIKK